MKKKSFEEGTRNLWTVVSVNQPVSHLTRAALPAPHATRFYTESPVLPDIYSPEPLYTLLYPGIICTHRFS